MIVYCEEVRIKKPKERFVKSMKGVFQSKAGNKTKFEVLSIHSSRVMDQGYATEFNTVKIRLAGKKVPKGILSAISISSSKWFRIQSIIKMNKTKEGLELVCLLDFLDFNRVPLEGDDGSRRAGGSAKKVKTGARHKN